VKRVAEVAKAVGLEPEFVASGGGSDANIFNAHGIRTLVLSPGAMSVHTTEEHIALADMVKCTELLVSVLTNNV
jgi:tripeptide aminopeptidase